MKDSVSNTQIDDLRALVARSVRKMRLPSEVAQEAIGYLERALEHGISPEQNPKGYAAAAVYIASIMTHNRVTQDAIAHIFKVSVQTIRLKYMELVRLLGIGSNPR
jgi:transcription initiation factor TFIIB